jgi:hypothetical protein
MTHDHLGQEQDNEATRSVYMNGQPVDNWKAHYHKGDINLIKNLGPKLTGLIYC